MTLGDSRASSPRRKRPPGGFVTFDELRDKQVEDIGFELAEALIDARRAAS